MTDWGMVAIILCCGLIVDSILTKAKLSKLHERVDKLKEAQE